MEYMKRIGIIIMLFSILLSTMNPDGSDLKAIFILFIFSMGVGLFMGSVEKDKEKINEQVN